MRIEDNNIEESLDVSLEPELRQIIIDGLNTPLEECIDEKEVNSKYF